ncbi:MAG: hypothetical protein F6J94_09840 [Moorea sp. SIO1F2]|uniref:hypothetical protein n=1 Tax=unclassified Moorena TaxID=2683338 RepID=UPI0013B6D41D|nr:MULTISPECIES: hypothetical protein [unclassified Moorena]NEN96610.1 hypothetical protein [Moorena sp. SIO3I7]NEO06497.1 hypothetical protein [Moorena sp. SIO3I8]NET82224.1 hypothetical protein [Moorena sp. SIO1F2]
MESNFILHYFLYYFLLSLNYKLIKLYRLLSLFYSFDGNYHTDEVHRFLSHSLLPTPYSLLPTPYSLLPTHS